MSKFIHYEYQSDDICTEYMTLINKFLGSIKDRLLTKEDVEDCSGFIIITDTNFGDVLLTHDDISLLAGRLYGDDDFFFRPEILDKYDRLRFEELVEFKQDYEEDIKRDNINLLDFESEVKTFNICNSLESAIYSADYFDIEELRSGDKIDREYVEGVFSYIKDEKVDEDYCSDFIYFLSIKDDEDEINEILEDIKLQRKIEKEQLELRKEEGYD